MTRPTWHDTWLDVARIVAKRSLCVRDQVGAVVVSRANRLLETGHNGPPSGFQHMNQPCTSWCTRAAFSVVSLESQISKDYSDCPSLHAEVNSLLRGDRVAREGGTIYVTSHTCMGCAKAIANSGLETLYVAPSKPSTHRNPTEVYEFLDRCGITVYVVECKDGVD